MKPLRNAAGSDSKPRLLVAGFMAMGLLSLGTVHAQPAASPRGLNQTVQVLQQDLQSLQQGMQDLQRQVVCQSVPTVDVEVPAIADGSYLPAGGHVAGVAFVGTLLVGSTPQGPYRNYFVYDLRRLSPAPVLNAEDLVVAGELITYNKSQAKDGVDGFRSDSSDTLSLTLNRVAWMDNARIAQFMTGSAGSTGYVDLADGPVYGSYVASAASNGLQFNIRLSDMAVRDLNRANGGVTDPANRLLFAIGGTLGVAAGAADNAYLFGGGVPYASLALKVKRYLGTGCPMPQGTQHQ